VRIVGTLAHFPPDARWPMPRNPLPSLLIACLLLLSQVSAYAGHQCAAASKLQQHAAMPMPGQPMMADMHHHDMHHHASARTGADTQALAAGLTKNQHCDDCTCSSPCVAGANATMNSDWTLTELPIATTGLIISITNNLLDNDPAPPFRPPSQA
jgi:hypothetical protein